MPLQVKKVQLKVKDGNQYVDGDMLFNVDAEAWARGKRNGQTVPSTDPTYHNNAEYFAQQAATSAAAADQIVFTGNLAPSYSSSAAYQIGDYVMQNDTLYECITAIPSPGEAFNASHWREVMVSDIKEQVDNIIVVNEQAQPETKVQIETTDEDVDIALMSDLTTAVSSEQTRAIAAENLKVNRPLVNGQPSDGVDGQVLRTRGDGTTVWQAAGTPGQAQTQAAVNAWMDENAWEYVIPDNSITQPKISSNFLPYILQGAYTIDSLTQDLVSDVNTALTINKVVIVPNGTYYTSQPISVSEGKTLVIYGDLNYSGSDAAIVLDGVRYCTLYVNKIIANNGTCISLRARDGASNSFNEIHSMWLQGQVGIEFKNTASGNVGNQYHNVYSNYINASVACIKFDSARIPNVSGGWNGEIKLFGGEFIGSNAIGLYSTGVLTALRVFGVSFESLNYIVDLTNASEVTMSGCRNENANGYIFRGVCDCITIIGDYYNINSIDITNLTETKGMVFIGNIFDGGSAIVGTELHISPDFKKYATGTMNPSKMYRMYTSSSKVIGSDGSFPRIARLVTADTTYSLSPNFAMNGHREIIIYAEKSGITLTNSDGTKTLFTTSENTSVWRVTAADGNSYFSPSGFLVEKLTPYKQS